MNSESLVFSHQRQIVEKLAPSFDCVTVVTADASTSSAIPNVTTLSMKWTLGRSFLNAYRFLKIIVPILIKKRGNLIVFTHMAEVFAFLIAPICWLLRIPNHLWYAHASKSPYLYCSYPFLSSVITSTPGSCPLSGDKVKVIGQAIELKDFAVVDSPPLFPPLKWYHVGRIDPSKNLEVVIETIRLLRLDGYEMELDIYGGPSSIHYEEYSTKIASLAVTSDYAGWLKFHGPVPRAKLVEIAKTHDGFIHAFSGSLDKALLEAIASRRFVASSNMEFHRAFDPSEEFLNPALNSLYSQITYCIGRGEGYMQAEIERRYEALSSFHSLDIWISRLTKILLRDWN